jgi:hypothetical protein
MIEVEADKWRKEHGSLKGFTGGGEPIPEPAPAPTGKPNPDTMTPEEYAAWLKSQQNQPPQ